MSKVSKKARLLTLTVALAMLTSVGVAGMAAAGHDAEVDNLARTFPDTVPGIKLNLNDGIGLYDDAGNGAASPGHNSGDHVYCAAVTGIQERGSSFFYYDLLRIRGDTGSASTTIPHPIQDVADPTDCAGLVPGDEFHVDDITVEADLWVDQSAQLTNASDDFLFADLTTAQYRLATCSGPAFGTPDTGIGGLGILGSHNITSCASTSATADHTDQLTVSDGLVSTPGFHDSKLSTIPGTPGWVTACLDLGDVTGINPDTGAVTTREGADAHDWFLTVDQTNAVSDISTLIGGGTLPGLYDLTGSNHCPI